MPTGGFVISSVVPRIEEKYVKGTVVLGACQP